MSIYSLSDSPCHIAYHQSYICYKQDCADTLHALLRKGCIYLPENSSGGRNDKLQHGSDLARYVSTALKSSGHNKGAVLPLLMVCPVSLYPGGFLKLGRTSTVWGLVTREQGRWWSHLERHNGRACDEFGAGCDADQVRCQGRQSCQGRGAQLGNIG